MSAADEFADLMDGLTGGKKKPDPRTLQMTFASEFTVTTEEPLVRGLLGQGEFIAIIGAPGSYKTTVAVDLACSIAHGLPFMGREVTQGSVLFVELEGEAMLKHRALAWHRHYGLALPDSFAMVSAAISLADGADSSDVISLRAAADLLDVFSSLRLIVVDTLACAAGGLDENSASDMSKLVSALRAIGAPTGAAVMVLHHTGLAAESRARGSSALRGALDVELLVKRIQGVKGGTITAEKMRNREVPPPMGFEAVTVAIGADDRGELITAAVTVPGAVPTKAKEKPLSGGEQMAVKVLDGLLLKEGQTVTNCTAAPKGTQGVREERWRDEFMAGQSSSTAQEDSHRKAFDRAVKGLVVHGDVVRHSGWCWKPDDFVLMDNLKP